MIGYQCVWCHARLDRGEKLITLNILDVSRKPKRWAASSTLFDSGHDEVTLHADCFLKNAHKIVELLFPYGCEPPKKRTVEFKPPMV